MSHRIACLAIFLLLAAGCATTPMQWTKPGATADEAGLALYNCRREAQREARYSDWYGGYGSSFHGGWGYPYRPTLVRDRFGRLHQVWPSAWYSPFHDPFYSGGQEESRLRNFCMRAQGYQLVPAS